MSRRRVLALGALGGLAVGLALLLVLTAHRFEPFAPAEKVAQVLTDGIWVAAGLVAWHRRPANRVGALMTAVGLIDLAHLYYWDAALPFTLSTLIAFLGVPVTIHLFLAYPEGRLTSRLDRRLTGFAYIATPLLAVVDQLFWDPAYGDCPACPPNLLLVFHSQAGLAVLDSVGEAVLVGLLLAVAARLVHRVRHASRATRRALAPVLVTAASAVVGLGAVVLADALGFQTEGSWLLWAADVAYALVPVAFLLGLVRTRFDRTRVADLVLALGSTRTTAGVREAIAEALGDPSVELEFWLPEDGRFVDEQGLPGRDPTGPGRSRTVIERDGRRVAAMVHDPALREEPELLAAVGAAAALALENSRLEAELRAQLREVRESRSRIVAAGDAERRRLERNLHDGAQQRLLGIRLALSLARNRLPDAAAVGELLTEADAEVLGAVEELRALARGIHPAILTEEGLPAALTALARRVTVPVTVDVPQGPRLPGPVEATAYFVAAESLANVVKHADATAVRIAVTRCPEGVAVEISDDGQGGADPRGAGLSGLRDRVDALDGRLLVESPVGRGTHVRAVIPCA